MLVMQDIRAFFSAALPWLTMGIVSAVFAARGVSRGKNSAKTEDTPFTQQGAERQKRLGIRCIWIFVVAAVLAAAVAALQGAADAGTSATAQRSSPGSC